MTMGIVSGRNEPMREWKLPADANEHVFHRYRILKEMGFEELDNGDMRRESPTKATQRITQEFMWNADNERWQTLVDLNKEHQ